MSHTAGRCRRNETAAWGMFSRQTFQPALLAEEQKKQSGAEQPDQRGDPEDHPGPRPARAVTVVMPRDVRVRWRRDQHLKHCPSDQRAVHPRHPRVTIEAAAVVIKHRRPEYPDAEHREPDNDPTDILVS